MVRACFAPLGMVVVCAVGLLPSVSYGIPLGDCAWNYRTNGDDRFHDNDSWVRPWESGSPVPPWPSASENGTGRWLGGHSYSFGWGYTDRISVTWGSNGQVYVNADRDRQWRAWTYVYVDAGKDITFSGGGDCVPKIFLDGAFDSPMGFGQTIYLGPGWHRIDYTGYNQNSGFSFSSGSLDVKVIDSQATPEPITIALLATAGLLVLPRTTRQGRE